MTSHRGGCSSEAAEVRQEREGGVGGGHETVQQAPYIAGWAQPPLSGLRLALHSLPDRSSKARSVSVRSESNKFRGLYVQPLSRSPFLSPSQSQT